MAAASFPQEEFDDKFLTCDVCQNIYDNPRVLPCLHTFCANCLEQWRKGQSQFTCPNCRYQVRLQETDVSNLPPNFYINNLLDFRALKNSEESQAHCQMCEAEAKIEGTCGDCRFLLCSYCITAHSKTPALKNHYIITLHDLKNPSSRAKYTRAEYCPKHTDQCMTFYCLYCAKLVCRDCTIAEHRPGPNHDPQEVSEVAQEYKTELQTLAEKTQDAAEALKKAINTVNKDLTIITTNCELEKRKLQEHFAQLRAEVDKAEQEVTEKLEMMGNGQKEPLHKERKVLEETLSSTEDGLQVCKDVLARDNNVEILTLGQQLEDRLGDILSTALIQHGVIKNHISFQPTSDDFKCELSLMCKPIVVMQAPVESLPTTIVFRPQASQVWETNPQVTVTSPLGQCAKLDTTRTSKEAFEAVWRPQTSAKHVLGVVTGGMGGATRGGETLCSPLTVDVCNPVLRFGKKGSQQGQFDSLTDLAVRGDRLYVADSGNKRVQVFDLSGNFCYSISMATNPWSLASQTDGTIVVSSTKEVKKFSPEGELLHEFSLDKHCPNPYSLAVQRDGRVVVADSYKHSIFLFEADGTLVRQVGGQGQGEGQFNDPSFVCVDKEDSIIVSDSSNHRDQVLDKNLIFHHKFGQTFQHKFGQWGRQPQDMLGPAGVSADSRGNILVVLANVGGVTADGVERGQKLQVFRSDGTWVSNITSDGEKLSSSCGVAVTEDGHVFVADVEDNCIRKYRYM